jgi:hypothetical protein
MGRRKEGRQGLKLIPRSSYRFLSVWLAILREPYREEILWDIRWGIRHEYKKRRNLNRLYQRHSTDYWFQREVISACGNSLLMRTRNILTIIMTLIKFVS